MSQESVAQDPRAGLYNEVYAEVFFNKLASRGIYPASESEANELLDMGARLYQVELQARQQAAANTPIKRAYAALLGVQQPAAPVDNVAATVDATIKQAMQSPRLRELAVAEGRRRLAAG